MKTEECYRNGSFADAPRNLERKFSTWRRPIRHLLKSFGIKLGGTSRGKVGPGGARGGGNDLLSSELMEPSCGARRAVEGILPVALVKIVAALSCAGDPRRPAGDGLIVDDSDRRSIALPSLARCRGLLRVDVVTAAVRNVGEVKGGILTAGDSGARRTLHEVASV